MGSDLHMSPPTPDEYRVARNSTVTAVYSRHTDGIYGDTRTWTRQHHISDPDGVALKTLRATHRDWPVVTVSEQFEFPEEMVHQLLATPDRDWEREQRELENKVQRAKERAASAHESVVAAEVELQRFVEERRKAAE